MSEDIQEILDSNTTLSNNTVQAIYEETKSLSNLSMEELITELENLCKIRNPYSVSKKSEEIKTLFYKLLKSENNEEDISKEAAKQEKKTLHPLEIKFKNANNKYRKRKSEYRKTREEQEDKNLIIKQNIISEIDNLVKEKESLKVTFAKFKDLQKKWKNTGM